MVDELIEVKPHNNTSLLLMIASSEQRVLDINRLIIIQHNHLSEAIKKRWKIMYDKGDFFKYEILTGDLGFGGWAGCLCLETKEETYV